MSGLIAAKRLSAFESKIEPGRGPSAPVAALKPQEDSAAQTEKATSGSRCMPDRRAAPCSKLGERSKRHLGRSLLGCLAERSAARDAKQPVTVRCVARATVAVRPYTRPGRHRTQSVPQDRPATDVQLAVGSVPGRIHSQWLLSGRRPVVSAGRLLARIIQKLLGRSEPTQIRLPCLVLRPTNKAP